MPAGHGEVTQGFKPLIGQFGRLFKLPPGAFGTTTEERDINMRLLGAAVTAPFDAPKDGPDNEESGIPALFTYFGQFVDHDLTFGPEGTFHTNPKLDPAEVVDLRTPDFDLDCVYGRGPDDQPYLYQPPAKGGEMRLMLMGNPIAGGTMTDALDLPRNSVGRALLGDKRNDENVIVSQLQALFLRFHNHLALDHPGWSFAQVQQQVQFHYQWVVLNDFLPRIVHSKVIDALRTGGHWDRTKLKLFDVAAPPFMPVEFSVAAYRLGHSMIRPGYRLNDAVLMPIFPMEASETRGSFPLPQGMAGFIPMTANWALDWGRFIDLDERGYGTDPTDASFDPRAKQNFPLMLANFNRLQFAYRIDTSLVDPLRNLPPSVTPPPASLAERNLKRGVDFGLPSGQAVWTELKALELDVGNVIDPGSIKLGKATDDPTDLASLTTRLTDAAKLLGIGDNSLNKAIEVFSLATPLWIYILAEAQTNQEPVAIRVTNPGKPAAEVMTPKLGPVGGRIVAETILALMVTDENSYLNSKTPFVPAEGENFGLRDLVRAAIKPF